MQHANATLTDRLLRKKQVREKCGGWSEMTIHRYLKDPKYRHYGFPQPVYISSRPYWKESQIDAWIDSRTQEGQA